MFGSVRGALRHVHRFAVGRKPRSQRFNRSWQGLSLAVTVAMVCLSLRPLSAAAATRKLPWRAPLVAPADMTSSAPSPAAPGEVRLGVALDALEQALGQRLAPTGKARVGDAELGVLRTRLATLDQEALQDFARVERELQAMKLDAEFPRRHREAVAQYRARMAALQSRLSAADGARDEGTRRARLDEAWQFLARQKPTRSHAPVRLDRLPFRAGEPTRLEPLTTERALQARLGPTPRDIRTPSSSGPGTVSTAALPTPADLAANEDAQITPAIQALATSLGHDPVAIYKWVRNTVRFVPTHGSVQGSALTLAMKRGNAFDTASLLVALLRASNIPARYVYGTVRIPAAQAMNWVGGAPSVEAAQDVLSRGGIPTVAILQNGRINFLQLEHVWVEAWVDFEPSRGAVQKQGDTWVALDASFKQHQVTAPMDLQAAVSIDYGRLKTDVAQALDIGPRGEVTRMFPGYMKQTLEGYLAETQARLAEEHPEVTADDLLGSVKVVADTPSVLPTGLPYPVVARAASASTLSPALRHSVTLTLYASQMDRAYDSPELSYTISLPALNSRRLGVHYRPASAGDAQVIQNAVNSGATSVPAYLIRVVPEVQLDGVTVAQGSVVTMGQEQSWALSLQDPSGYGLPPDFYDVVAGSEVVFGVNGNGLTQQVSSDRLATMPSDTVAENLHQAALHYWFEHDLFDGLTAASLGVHAQRLPSAGLFSTPMEVRYWFGIPRSGTFASHVMDVQRVLVGVTAGSAQKQFDFMSRAGLQGSYLEGSVFEQLLRRFQGTGQSTAQVLIDAAAQNIPIYTVDADNVATVLPHVQASADVLQEIANAAAAGKRITIPQHPPRDVTGYIIQDPQTGAAAYLIEGGLNGGRQPSCAQQPQPVPHWIVDLAFKIFIMLLLAAVLAAILGSGGTLAPAGAAAIVVIAASLTLGAGNAYASQRLPCCVVKPVPHLGGDPVHNACADAIGPNDYPGMDAFVDVKNFDAVTGNASLWEVKTYNLANCTTSFCQSVLLPQWVAQTRSELAFDIDVAHSCGYLFSFGAGDWTFVALVDPTGTGAGLYDALNVQPYCLQP